MIKTQFPKNKKESIESQKTLSQTIIQDKLTSASTVILLFLASTKIRVAKRETASMTKKCSTEKPSSRLNTLRRIKRECKEAADRDGISSLKMAKSFLMIREMLSRPLLTMSRHQPLLKTLPLTMTTPLATASPSTVRQKEGLSMKLLTTSMKTLRRITTTQTHCT